MTSSIRISTLTTVLAVFLAALSAAPADAGDHKFGIGAHYFTAIDDFVDDDFDIDEDGLAWVVSYQYLPGGLFSFELDVEYFPDGFGGSADSSYAPTAFILFGHGLYVGVGIGVTISDELEDNVSDPFYAARLGWNLALLPSISLDINANYRAEAFSDLDQADTDAITLGAILRFSF